MNSSPPKTNSRTRSGRAFLSTAFMVAPGPKTSRAALKTTEVEEWTGAVNTESAALDSHQAMEFMPENSQGTIVNSRWLLSKKFKAAGEIDKYKARLIAQGCTQKEGQDFDGNAISALVVDASTIRLCLGLAAERNRQVNILDCSTASLGSAQHGTIYLRLPEGNWQDPWKRQRPLVRLRKTLYGLKQSARGWFEDVDDFLVDHLALTASVAAPGLFLGDGIIVLVYVDGIMILTTTFDKLTSVCNDLQHHFRAASPKGASIPISDHFQHVGLDVQLDHKSRTAYVNQSGYIAMVLEQFGMAACQPGYTPMAEGLKLGLSAADTGEPSGQQSAGRTWEHPEPVDQSLYRQAVASLLYIALGSRPDIVYAATTLGRYSSNPDQRHWTALKHLCRYLKVSASENLALTSPSDSGPCSRHGTSTITAFAHADLGGDVHTGKSTTGYLLYVLGILVLWKSKGQTLGAQSTMESELIASAAVKRQIDWFSCLLSDLAPILTPSMQGASGTAQVSSPPVVLNDNFPCVTVLSTGNFKGDSRHLRLRFYSLHEAIATEKLVIKHVRSDGMLAEGLKKALGRIKHEAFVKEIGLI
jgi:hypothetical protein